MPPDPPSKSRLRRSKWALSRPYCQYSELCHAKAYKQKKARNAPDCHVGVELAGHSLSKSIAFAPAVLFLI